MSPMGKDVLRKLAMRLVNNPTAATVDDVRKLTRGLLLLIDGRLPQ